IHSMVQDEGENANRHSSGSRCQHSILWQHSHRYSFHSGNPEGFHQLMHLFSDRGTPASLRHMNAYSGHTYKFTTADGGFKYIKVHIKTNQGVKNFTAEEAERIAGENPDFLIQ